MAKKKSTAALSRRERQIMDVIFRLEEATVGEVLDELPDPPSYSSIRTLIRKLESQGFLKHREDGRRYVYRATQSREKASRTATQRLMDVFFAGSPSDAVAAILDVSDNLEPDDLDRIQNMIEQARQEGK